MESLGSWWLNPASKCFGALRDLRGAAHKQGIFRNEGMLRGPLWGFLKKEACGDPRDMWASIISFSKFPDALTLLTPKALAL